MPPRQTKLDLDAGKMFSFLVLFPVGNQSKNLINMCGIIIIQYLTTTGISEL